MQTLALVSFVALQLVLPPEKKESLSVRPPVAAEPAVLQFKWPEGIAASVDTERSREQQAGSTEKPTRVVKGSYKLRVRPHEAGLVVRSEEFSGLQANEVILKGLGVEDLVAALVPSTVVTRAGEFVRVEDTAAVKECLTKMVAPFVSGDKELPAPFKEMLEGITSDEFLNATAAAEWNSLIGAWLDFPLTTEVFEQTVEEPSPVLPDLMIPMKVTQRMVEKGQCLRGGTPYDCAWFEMRSDVDPAAMQQIMARMMAGFKDVADKITFEEFDLITVVRVRLETATMLPHEMTMTRTINLKMSAPDVPSLSTRQVDRRTSTFSY